jgi:2-polyprenyl-3-methyl-5-hydroxy-6-metoxy-1,4-benzoquinol methylase
MLYNYPGEELDNFENAKIFRIYSYILIKNFIKSPIIEVGAGIGSFAATYINKNKKIFLVEPDKNMFLKLKKRFKKKAHYVKNFNTIKNKFNTIIYMSVLEHIKNDTYEINKAIDKLKLNGHLIILVPAHQKLFSTFDQKIGHYRRYEKKYFNRKFNNAKLIQLRFVDSLGYFLYFLNKIFFKKDENPSKFKIFIWDKFFCPLSVIFDYILNYRVGKNIIAVYKKISENN